MKKILLSLLLTTSLFAKSTTERAGDLLALLLPAAAFSTTLYYDDREGQIEFYKSYAFTMASTMVLKYSIDEKRPDTQERDSFPSGHTASAFAGASFIHKRYGWQYALPAYLGAIYTGYSRVDAKRHHTQDVVAGAFLAIASSWYFTSTYKNVEIFPSFGENKNSINLHYHW
jgi:membrane-associated phospholipid phosphatase